MPQSEGRGCDLDQLHFFQTPLPRGDWGSASLFQPQAGRGFYPPQMHSNCFPLWLRVLVRKPT